MATTSSNSKTSQEKDDLRKGIKAAQKRRKAAEAAARKAAQGTAHRSIANSATGSTLLDGFREDREARRAEAAQVRREEELNTPKKLSFPERQANKALESAAIKALPKDGLARKVALQIVKEFPGAKASEENGKKISRTQAAVLHVQNILTPEQMAETKELKAGIDAARIALRGAWHKLNNS